MEQNKYIPFNIQKKKKLAGEGKDKNTKIFHLRYGSTGTVNWNQNQ